MNIAIFGLGYVGMTAAACLAREGHQIFGVDVSDEKIEMVNRGRSPISEPGLDKLTETSVRDGLLRATSDASPYINSCETAFVCVGTPSAPDGSHNMSYIAEVSRQIAAMTDPERPFPLAVIYRSTIRPGTMEDLISPIFEQTLGTASNRIELVYNPEFLRESVAINDFFNPPKIVVGTRDGERCKNLDLLNHGIDAPIFYTKFREAELTKFVDNTFHAVKIGFANEIGRICTLLGISARTTHSIFISDTKLNISPYYLRPGGAFGGSCLPKDVRALQQIAVDSGANASLLDSLLRSNEAHKHFLFERCIKGLNAGAKILLLGLAFKADSDDLRESPNIDLARKILHAGFDLSVYDPYVDPAKLLGQNLGYAFSNLPTLRRLLVSRENAESGDYDLVIDAQDLARKLVLKTEQIININTLD